MAKIDKARFWTGVLYPENMREDWKEVIGDTLQYPYALEGFAHAPPPIYCIL